MLFYVERALDSNKTALTLLAECLIPAVFNLESFLLKFHEGGTTDTEKCNYSKKLIRDIISKSLDVEAQAKGTEGYIEWIFDDYAKKAVDIPSYPVNTTRQEMNDMYSPWWDKFRDYEAAHKALAKTYYPERVNDALQSNFRVMIKLTNLGGLNRVILELEEFILKTFRNENSGLENYIRSREFIRKIISLSLEITTHVVYTGRCLNSKLNPSASAHTKKGREPMKRKDIKEMYSEF